jgi:hypothetical protein
MPTAMSHLRPMRSESAPVASCPAPRPPGTGGQDADLTDGQAVAGEQDREQAPGDAVVEVVDHARLTGRGQGRFGEAGQPGDLVGGQMAADERVDRIGEISDLDLYRFMV